jgi:protease I
MYDACFRASKQKYLNMKKAIILIGPGFEDSEFLYPFYRLQEAGYAVDVACWSDKPAAGKYGVPATPTINLENLKANDYEVVVVPGGHESPDRVRQIPKALALIRDMNKNGRIISSVCHGPWVLVSACVVKGRRITCYKGCRDDLINAGALWIDEPVVTDGNLITAQHFRDNPEWMRQTLLALQKID